MIYAYQVNRYTCLFLATKAEHHFISIENFAEPLSKVTPDSILELEFTVAQALSFTLLVHHAFNAIHGYYLDMQTVFPNRLEAIGVAHDIARRHANDSLFSDTSFLFTPPQIALASLSMANEELVRDYLEHKFSNKPDLLKNLLSEVYDIKGYIIAGSQKPSKERLVNIDKKLYFCINPDKIKKRKPDDNDSQKSDDIKRLKI